MYRSFVFAILVLTPFTASAGDFSIRVEFAGEGPQKVRLERLQGSSWTLEEEQTSNGSQTLKFIQPFRWSELYRLKVGEGPNVSIVADAPEAVTVTVDENGKAKVSGSSGNDALTHFETQLQQIQMKHFMDLKQKVDALDWNDMSQIDEIRPDRDRKLNLFITEIQEVTEAMGPGAVAWRAMSYLDPVKMGDFFDRMLAQFNEKIPQSGVTAALRNQLQQRDRMAIGAQAPNFTLLNTQGDSVSLADYRGSYVLVDFWASWCVNCRMEHVKIKDIHREHANAPFKILGVTGKDSAQAWRMAVKRDKIPWTCVFDKDGDVVDTWMINALPANYLLDPQGRIIGKNLSPEQLAQKLKDLFPNR